jgi:hypothetical protein
MNLPRGAGCRLEFSPYGMKIIHGGFICRFDSLPPDVLVFTHSAWFCFEFTPETYAAHILANFNLGDNAHLQVGVNC